MCLEFIYLLVFSNLAVSNTWEFFRCIVFKKVTPTVSSFNYQRVRMTLYWPPLCTPEHRSFCGLIVIGHC